MNGLTSGATYALVALGFGLVFSVMRVINVAHPDLMMVSGYLTYVVGTALVGHVLGLPAFAILIAILVVCLVGVAALALVIQTVVIQPLQRRDILMPFLA